MNIIDIDLKPLNEYEIENLKDRYTQDFDSMDIKTASKLLKLLLPVMKSNNLDTELSKLLLRRLNMILDFKNYPERLL